MAEGGNCFGHIVCAKMLIFVYMKYKISSVCQGKILQFNIVPTETLTGTICKEYAHFQETLTTVKWVLLALFDRVQFC